MTTLNRIFLTLACLLLISVSSPSGASQALREAQQLARDIQAEIEEGLAQRREELEREIQAYGHDPEFRAMLRNAKRNLRSEVFERHTILYETLQKSINAGGKNISPMLVSQIREYFTSVAEHTNCREKRLKHHNEAEGFPPNIKRIREPQWNTPAIGNLNADSWRDTFERNDVHTDQFPTVENIVRGHYVYERRYQEARDFMFDSHRRRVEAFGERSILSLSALISIAELELTLGEIFSSSNKVERVISSLDVIDANVSDKETKEAKRELVRDALTLRAKVFASQGRYKEAAASLRQIESEPESADLTGEGQSHESSGRLVEMLAHDRLALLLEPAALGASYRRLRDFLFSEITIDYAKGCSRVQRIPHTSDVILLMTYVHLNLGNTGYARHLIYQYEQTKRWNHIPYDEVLLYHLVNARYYQLIGDHGSSRDHLSNGLEILEKTLERNSAVIPSESLEVELIGKLLVADILSQAAAAPSLDLRWSELAFSASQIQIRKPSSVIMAQVFIGRNKPVSMKQLQASLGPEEAFFHTTSGVSGRLYSWLITSDHLGFLELNSSEDSLENLTEKLRQGLISSEESLPVFDFWAARRIFDLLFSQHLKKLGNVEVLYVSSDGALDPVPLMALVTADPDKKSSGFKDVEWLIRKFAISRVPSAPAFISLRARNTKSTYKQRSSFLGVGNPALRGPYQHLVGSPNPAVAFRSGDLADKVSQLPPLPETERELRDIAQRFPERGRTLLLGRDATELKVRESNLSDASVVMFSTHAVGAGELTGLDVPALVLSPPNFDSKDGHNDGLLKSEEIFDLEFDADIVILAACNTGVGSIGERFDLSELSRAFFYSGARSLLVSHWNVHSRATSELMSRAFSGVDFDRPDIEYGNRQFSLALALQNGVLDLLQDAEYSEFWHPFYWAPFFAVDAR